MIRPASLQVQGPRRSTSREKPEWQAGAPIRHAPLTVKRDEEPMVSSLYCASYHLKEKYAEISYYIYIGCGSGGGDDDDGDCLFLQVHNPPLPPLLPMRPHR